MFHQPKSIWGLIQEKFNNDVRDIVGSGAPTDGTSGSGVGLCGPGSTYTDIATGYVYRNTNTKASPAWKLNLNAANISGDITVSNAGVSAIGSNKVLSGMLATNIIQRTTGTIASADITGTSAGQLGHANGVTLQAAPGANKALMLIAFGLYFTYATAAYTGGGNITVNWGAGGAALTGVVSAANSLGASANKAVMFFPLSTAGVAIVSNAALSLVAASAFTQPGTAAGTVAWELFYRELAVGF